MERLLDFYLGMGIQNLRAYGSVAPVAFIFNGTKMTIHMMNFNDKDLAIQTLRSICRELNADKVIIMAEAFYSKDLSGVRPSMAPDREECIMVQGENISGDSGAIVQPFYRDNKGKIRLKQKIKLLEVLPLSRMANILNGETLRGQF